MRIVRRRAGSDIRAILSGALAGSGGLLASSDRWSPGSSAAWSGRSIRPARPPADVGLDTVDPGRRLQRRKDPPAPTPGRRDGRGRRGVRRPPRFPPESYSTAAKPRLGSGRSGQTSVQGLKPPARPAERGAGLHPTNRRGDVFAAFLQVRSIPIPRLGPLRNERVEAFQDGSTRAGSIRNWPFANADERFVRGPGVAGTGCPLRSPAPIPTLPPA